MIEDGDAILMTLVGDLQVEDLGTMNESSCVSRMVKAFCQQRSPIAAALVIRHLSFRFGAGLKITSPGMKQCMIRTDCIYRFLNKLGARGDYRLLFILSFER
jgi:hypothetical protein